MWESEWQSHLPTSSWPTMKNKSLGKAKQNRENWNVILTTFSLYGTPPCRQEISLFIEQAKKFHTTIKLTAEISEIETTFLDTIIYKGDRFRNDAILDIHTHYKPTETFQNTHFTLCHPPGVKRGFITGETLRLLGTNYSGTMFEGNLSKFKLRPIKCGYPKNLYEEHCQRSILLQDTRLSHKRTKRVNESCLLSQHTNRQCGTLETFWCLTGI